MKLPDMIGKMRREDKISRESQMSERLKMISDMKKNGKHTQVAILIQKEKEGYETYPLNEVIHHGIPQHIGEQNRRHFSSRTELR